MATTPGLPVLSGIRSEREAILKVLDTHFTVRTHDQPSADDIIHSLENCSIAHFACHGLTDHIDPSKSGLVFQKQEGPELLTQNLVTVQSIAHLDLKYARLAYLSACSTAENRAASLRDEVIHLVSGFQAAGFAHVIGCQWPSADFVCVEIAKHFYSTLLKEDCDMASRSVVLALHEATAVIREENRDQPLYWAQFVHFGA